MTSEEFPRVGRDYFVVLFLWFERVWVKGENGRERDPWIGDSRAAVFFNVNGKRNISWVLIGAVTLHATYHWPSACSMIRSEVSGMLVEWTTAPSNFSRLVVGSLWRGVSVMATSRFNTISFRNARSRASSAASAESRKMRKSETLSSAPCWQRSWRGREDGTKEERAPGIGGEDLGQSG